MVWVGRRPGIYPSWDDCRNQTHGFEGARYKAFPSMAQAEEALTRGYSATAKATPDRSLQGANLFNARPVMESISVDAAWNTVSKVMEYRGVFTDSRKEIFRMGPFADATNNIGEFLAIVHAQALQKNKNRKLIVYSDSNTAITWYRNKKANTKLAPTPQNAELFELLKRAEAWLKENSGLPPVLKWKTEAWGEIPADFGRK